MFNGWINYKCSIAILVDHRDIDSIYGHMICGFPIWSDRRTWLVESTEGDANWYWILDLSRREATLPDIDNISFLLLWLLIYFLLACIASDIVVIAIIIMNFDHYSLYHYHWNKPKKNRECSIHHYSIITIFLEVAKVPLHIIIVLLVIITMLIVVIMYQYYYKLQSLLLNHHCCSLS